MLPLTARTWSLILALVWAIPGHAGVIRGTVKLPATANAARARQAYPGRAGSMLRDSGPDRGRVSDAIVAVERIPAAVESSLAALPRSVPRLAQKNQTFAPRVLAVAVGTTVDFPNLDPIFHNVFSVSPGRRFDLGKYPRGHSRSVVFNRTGLVEVYCDIHADMAAFVLVLPNHAFAQADERGNFELPDLPAGDYGLRLWHPDLPEIRRAVVVPAEGGVEVQIEYRNAGNDRSARAAQREGTP